MININLLPKHLRWVREPAHWRLLAILFPIVIGAVVFLMNTVTHDSIKQLENEILNTRNQLNILEPHIVEHGQLSSVQQQLNSIMGISLELSADKINWSQELLALLGHLPKNNAGELTVEFTNVSVRALNPPQQNPDLYRGRTYYTEFQVSGRAITYEAVTDFVRTLEQSDIFGVQFHNSQRAGESTMYSFSLTIVSVDAGDRQ